MRPDELYLRDILSAADAIGPGIRPIAGGQALTLSRPTTAYPMRAMVPTGISRPFW